ncbi:MAG: hypothetical protein ACK5OX_11710 [Desertimonas sp.]
MRTRTLLLLAVACGVAILVAGAALFIQLAGQDEPAEPIGLGVEATVGDLDVAVDSFVDGDDRVEVIVELGGVDDDDAASGFTLVTPSGPVGAADDIAGTDPAVCRAVTVAARRCTLVFTLPPEPGTTRVLVLRRGGEQIRWDLVTA